MQQNHRQVEYMLPSSRQGLLDNTSISTLPIGSKRKSVLSPRPYTPASSVGPITYVYSRASTYVYSRASTYVYSRASTYVYSRASTYDLTTHKFIDL
jgi:hypothetical protein